MYKRDITTIIRITGGIIHARAADLGQAFLGIVIHGKSGTGMAGLDTIRDAIKDTARAIRGGSMRKG